jgi:hypothetical protein
MQQQSQNADDRENHRAQKFAILGHHGFFTLPLLTMTSSFCGLSKHYQKTGGMVFLLLKRFLFFGIRLPNQPRQCHARAGRMPQMRALQEYVVVGVLIILLQQVVIDVSSWNCGAGILSSFM